jgi:hypothetical protein
MIALPIGDGAGESGGDGVGSGEDRREQVEQYVTERRTSKNS